MSAQFLKTSAAVFAVGVRIKTIDSQDEEQSEKARKRLLQEAKRFATASKADLLAIAPTVSGVIAVCAKSSKAKHDLPLMPAILSFSMHDLDANDEAKMYLIKLENDQCALQVCLNGSPYSDEIISTADVSEAILNKSNELQKVGMKLYVTPGFAESVTESIGEHSVLDLSDLPVIADFIFKKTSDNKRAIVLGVVTFGVLSFMAFDYYNTKKQEQLEEEQAQVQALAPKANNAEQYETSVRTQLKTAGNEGKSVAESLRQFFKSETSDAGFVMTAVTCQSGNCSETWLKVNGTRDSFMTKYPTGVSFDANQVNAIKSSSLATTVSEIPFEKLRTYKEIEAAVLSNVERINQIAAVTVSFTAAKIYALPKGMKIEQIPADKQVKSGGFVLNGPLSLLIEMLEQMPECTAVRTVTIDQIQTDNPKFKVEGEYFVK